MSDDDLPLVDSKLLLPRSHVTPSHLIPAVPVPSCSDSSPLPKKGRGLRSKPARKKSQRPAAPAAAICSDSSPLPKKGRGSRAKKQTSNRQRYMTNPLLALQCKEGRAGDTASEESNSSDDCDESDIPEISQTNDHSNAEHHVYQEGMGTQGSDSKFNTPLHKQRASSRGLVPLAGA